MVMEAPLDVSIDDYDIGQLLGRGGFASVYRARERRTGSLFALKIMDKANIRKHNMESRVANEIKIQSELLYEGIVQSYCHFEDAENVYMVLELCEGGNLYRYLKTYGPLNETEASIVIKQLLLSLEYMHGIGVVHRDLKLSNVLLVQSNSALSSSFSSPSSSSSSSYLSGSGYGSQSGTSSFLHSNSHPHSRNAKLGMSSSFTGSINKHQRKDSDNYEIGRGDGSWNRNENNNRNLRIGNNHGVVLPFSKQREGRFSDFTVKLCDFGLAVQVEHPDEVFSTNFAINDFRI